MSTDSVYAGLVSDEATEVGHWAFGTGFADPIAELSATPPVLGEASAHIFAAACLALGDDALVMAHRLSEWCSRAPDLEEDIALANIALDLLGQARFLLGRAGVADPALVVGLGIPDDAPAPVEDRLAFFRDADDFRNVTLVELPRGDFADVVVKVLLFATARLPALAALQTHPDPVLSGVGTKGGKETRYHQGFAARWFEVLARGTSESRGRLVAAVETLWPRLAELLAPDPVLRAGLGVDPADTADEVYAALEGLCVRCGLEPPAREGLWGAGGRDGVHTEALSLMLAEMQSVARAHPRGLW